MGSSISKSSPKYTSRHYDWEKEEGGYIPYRHQGKQKQWRKEERAARVAKIRLENAARAQAHWEREAARQSRYQPVNAKKVEFRRQYDEYMAAKSRLGL